MFVQVNKHTNGLEGTWWSHLGPLDKYVILDSICYKQGSQKGSWRDEILAKSEA